jgi:hypothetical protein
MGYIDTIWAMGKTLHEDLQVRISNFIEKSYSFGRSFIFFLQFLKGISQAHAFSSVEHPISITHHSGCVNNAI